MQDEKSQSNALVVLAEVPSQRLERVFSKLVSVIENLEHRLERQDMELRFMREDLEILYRQTKQKP